MGSYCGVYGCQNNDFLDDEGLCLQPQYTFVIIIIIAIISGSNLYATKLP